MNLPTLRRLGAALLLAAGTAAGASTPPAPAGEQVLVMVPLAPLHFHGTSGYGASYDDPGVRAARARVAGALARSQQLTLVSSWPMPALEVDCLLLRLPPGRALGPILQALSEDPRVAWAQPLHHYRTLGHNDPLYPLQPAAQAWHLTQIHGVATGRNVTVAVVDSGVELSHPDLQGRIAVAQDFVDEREPAPAEFHGTAVAGIIAATADNGIGIAGVAPQARVLALRACWQGEQGTTDCDSFTLAKALQFALVERAAVINLSLTGPQDPLLQRLLDAAQRAGTAVVCALDPQRSDGGFPASHPGVLAVAADEDAAAATAISAPGRDIPATLPGERWGFVSGSSFAAAQISGVLALLRELAPDLRPEQARARLLPGGDAAAHAGDGPPPLQLHTDVCRVLARLARNCDCACAPAAPAVVSRR
jgi:hypothetical protein